jgi:AcrR family transcriptional regulator
MGVAGTATPPADPEALAAASWAQRYQTADDLERRLVAAGVRCVARWGLAKTSLDDVAREAGVSRATVYRSFPGGKERLLEVGIQHELGRLFLAAEAQAAAATTLEDLLCAGIAVALRELSEHAALQFLLAHEPEAILPHVAFHRLGPVLAAVAELSRPHLSRFLPGDEVRPAAELVTRLILSFTFSPSEAVDANDAASIRRLVRTYLLPAMTRPDPEEHP